MACTNCQDFQITVSPPFRLHPHAKLCSNLSRCWIRYSKYNLYFFVEEQKKRYGGGMALQKLPLSCRSQFPPCYLEQQHISSASHLILFVSFALLNVNFLYFSVYRRAFFTKRCWCMSLCIITFCRVICFSISIPDDSGFFELKLKLTIPTGGGAMEKNLNQIIGYNDSWYYISLSF